MILEKVASIVRGHFDSLANMYDEKSSARACYLSTIDMLITEELRMQGPKKVRVLDVGCGTGTRAQNIFSSIPWACVYGIDVSPKMLKIARTKNFERVVQSDVRRIPFPDNYFDSVTCLFNVMGYLATPKERMRALNEIKRVLKPGGLFFVDFMNRWHLGENVNFKRSLLAAVGLHIKSLLFGLGNVGNIFFKLPLNGGQLKGFVHGFSLREIHRLLKKCEFSELRLSVVGYDTGQIKRSKWQGQYFVIARNQKKQLLPRRNHESCACTPECLPRKSHW